MPKRGVPEHADALAKSSKVSKRGVPDTDHPEQIHPSTKRAKEIDSHETPYEELKHLQDTQQDVEDVQNVLHWFRSKDLRIHDNKGLHAASELAKNANKPLICAYIDCPAELLWHGDSPARCDFICENAALVQKELAELDIPMVFLDAPKRNDIVPSTVRFVKENNISHVFANYEYEIDELRRDIHFLKDKDMKAHVSIHHDQNVVEPGTVVTAAGTPMKVFTPYHKAWLAVVKANPSLLDTVPAPSKNPSSTKSELSQLFDSKPPSPPKEKQYDSQEEHDRIRGLYPAGHDKGMERMRDFVHNKIEEYAAHRSNPSIGTSRMSAYWNTGIVSVREGISEIKKYNKGSSDFASGAASQGISAYVRELCFRELYRQTTMIIPHLSMNMAQNLKFQFVDWEKDEEGYQRWEKGTLGVPFVDAGMRQLNHEAYMHNRLRMNVSSYFYCNLLLDPKRGERYFVEKLIDWDLSNNTQGWEPSYTVFNPVSQAEKNDPEGEYIRRWIPELKNVKGKAVFDPANRLSDAEYKKLCPDYPKPYLDWHETKARALDRFKSNMKDADP